MISAFIDTAYLIALVLTDDAYHEKAVALHHQQIGQLITTEYVLFEYADGMCSARHRQLVEPTFGALRHDRRIEIVPASSRLLEAAMRLFVSRPDKEWSLTDCSSLIVMEERGLTDAFTSDHHFEQAGFRALLRN